MHEYELYHAATRKHKYIKKIGNRYFYTQQEIQAYYDGKKTIDSEYQKELAANSQKNNTSRQSVVADGSHAVANIGKRIAEASVRDKTRAAVERTVRTANKTERAITKPYKKDTIAKDEIVKDKIVKDEIVKDEVVKEERKKNQISSGIS